jgi:hypothetical protein
MMTGRTAVPLLRCGGCRVRYSEEAEMLDRNDQCTDAITQGVDR